VAVATRPSRLAHAWPAVVVGVMIVAPFCGCGGKSGPERAAVAGKVTLDGDEIDVGSIAFYPTGGTKGMVAGGPINNGRYSVSADQGPVVGQNRVEIHSPRKTGRKVPDAFGDPGATMDETAEAIRQRYNAKSTLERDVKPGRNTFDFALQSK
jgi:hypothetical protein